MRVSSRAVTLAAPLLLAAALLFSNLFNLLPSPAFAANAPTITSVTPILAPQLVAQPSLLPVAILLVAIACCLSVRARLPEARGLVARCLSLLVVDQQAAMPFA